MNFHLTTRSVCVRVLQPTWPLKDFTASIHQPPTFTQLELLVFELAFGYRPFSGLPGELMSAHINQPVDIPNKVSYLLRSVISTAMQKLPARRFSSATEMLKSVQLATEVEKLTIGNVPPLSIPYIDPLISAVKSNQL